MELLGVRKSLEELYESLDESRQEREKELAVIESSRESFIEADKEIKCNEATKKYNEELEILKAQRDKIESDFFDLSANINIAEYKRLFDERSGGLLSGPEELSSEVNEKLKKFLGDMLNFKLESKLNKYKSAKNIKSIDAIRDNYKKLAVSVKNMPRFSLNWVEFISYKVENLKTGNDLSKEKKEGSKLSDFQKFILIISSIAIVAFVGLLYFIFPIIAAICVLLFIYNIYSFSRMYGVAVRLKILGDSMENIQYFADKKIQDAVDIDKANLLKERTEFIEHCDSRLSDLNNKIMGVRSRTMLEYTPDMSSIDSEYSKIEVLFDKRDVMIGDNIESLRVRETEIEEKISSIKEELNAYFSTIQGQFLNSSRVGSEVIFEGNFLIDVRDEKPVFFKHPMESCLFIYDNTAAMEQFIRLLLLQLRNTMSPFNCFINVLDSMSMGTVALPFVHRDNALCTVSTSTQDISNTINDLSEVLAAKMILIRREFPNIKEYNQSMLEMESLPEAYRFVFSIDTEKLSMSDIMKQIIKNGAQVGIYVHTFIAKESMLSSVDAACDLMDLHGNIYLLGDKIRRRAKDVILETMFD
jgi:hypothetical protein